MADTEDPRRRFADLVKLSGLTSKFIDREAERRVLEEGVIRCGLSLDEARGMMRAVADDNDYVFESETERRVRQILDKQATKRVGVVIEPERVASWDHRKMSALPGQG